MHRIITATALVFFLTGLLRTHVLATHLRAGEITVTRLNCESFTFTITIRVFTRLNSDARFGEGILDFGDGSPVLVLPRIENTPRPDLGEDIGTASFTINHTYSGNGEYTISYVEPNRNEGVVNMDQSVLTTFYLETRIFIDPFLGCNQTPRLLVAPIDRACSGVAFFHHPGAFDPDGDSLSYEMVIPFRDRNQPVLNYQDPAVNNPRLFYLNYGEGNETRDGEPTFGIDPVSGELVWNAPGLQGEYNIAFIVKEWRKRDGVWVEMGFVRRDMQILVEDCDNDRPDLIIPKDTCVEAGTLLNAKIFGIDPENHPVKIEAFSEIFNFSPSLSPATYSPNPAVFQPSDPPAELDFSWQTTCDHVKDQYYQVVFKISDNPPDGPTLVTFKTWRIRVVAPPPVWVSADVNQPDRYADLMWDEYACTNASAIQVWRRVDSFPFDPDHCETGMPPFLGYTLVTTLPHTTTSFTDTNNGSGLVPGARYCYRLVAVFPQPKGGESYVSQEICIDPIEATAPVITNVSVMKTGVEDGVIEVKWVPPFDIDVAEFPGPYAYIVQRADGFSGTNFVNVHTGALSETSYTDQDLNTTNGIYNYRILLLDQSISLTTPIDTSFAASSVRLGALSQPERISLSWSALVPWSNRSAEFPLHDVYRGPQGSTEDDLVVVASVDVIFDGFMYADSDVEEGQTYCYRVMTRGVYGNDNPVITEPLENYSQLICVRAGEDELPCKPDTPLALNAPDCNTYTEQPDFSCDQEYFSNQITWNTSSADCGSNIAYYNIYAASVSGGEYTLLMAGVTDTFFEDDNLTSRARCYRITAVDHNGQESEWSDPVCIDNCPYYELPNIFTPNGDCWNRYFSAYSDRDELYGGPECGLSPENRKKCARFVEQVVFRAFNRWGQQVYSYSGRINSENNIYIDWDGRDSEGRLLSTGIYYYIAEVTFMTVDPARQNQTLKGWVHLLR